MPCIRRTPFLRDSQPAATVAVDHAAPAEMSPLAQMTEATDSNRRVRDSPNLIETFCFTNEESNMKLVQVLGPGCAKCMKLKENAEQAVQELGIEASVEKIEDINVITGFGVMVTPALAIDGEVKSVGKVLSSEEIQKLMS